jgi:hypothetical protein
MTGKQRPDDPLGPIRRFARPALEGRRELDPFLCRHFGMKSWGFPHAGGDRNAVRSPSPSHYICLRTMRPDGPDGALATPETCVDERVCFDPAARAGADS